MKNKPQEQLKKILDNPESLSMDNMDDLVKNSIKFFSDYVELSKSGDKEAQEKALQELLDYKDMLQEVTEKTTNNTGMNQNELMESMNDPSNFSEEQWKSMESITESITDFNTSLMADLMPQIKKGSSVAAKKHQRRV